MVSLGQELVREIRQIARGRNITFMAALRQLLRTAVASQGGEAVPYRVPARPMGLKPGVDLTASLGWPLLVKTRS